MDTGLPFSVILESLKNITLHLCLTHGVCCFELRKWLFFCHITHCDIVLTQLISFNIVIFFFSYSDLFIKSNDTVSKV